MTLLLEKHTKKTNLFALYLLLIAILFTLTELSTSLSSGSTDSSSIVEIIIITLLIASTFLIFYSNSKRSLISLKTIKMGHKEIEALELKNKQLKEELTIRILNQFKQWHLSDAESEIALLLIKGFSTHEIASIRNSSERTVRKQASEIYRKTNQHGRATLAAYFIEDLL